MKKRTRKRTARRDPSKPFLVSKTYETWDEESVEAGDTDDKGFVYEPTPMTLREVMHELEELGSFEPSQWPLPKEATSIWFTTTDADMNYQTGEDTYESVHVKGKLPAMRRFLQVVREASKRR